jgi:hypothetical protein
MPCCTYKGQYHHDNMYVLMHLCHISLSAPFTFMASAIVVRCSVFYLYLYNNSLNWDEGKHTDVPRCHQHPQRPRLLTTRSISSLTQLEDERARLTQSGYFNEQEVYRQIDRRETDRVQPQDIINFLGVHRIAANERECQFLIWTAGSNEPHLNFSQYPQYHPDSRTTSPTDTLRP